MLADDRPRDAQGLDRPGLVDGQRIEGTFRSHQVPLSNPQGNPAHLEMLEQWMKRYRPEELFDGNGALHSTLRELAPVGARRMDRTLMRTADCYCGIFVCRTSVTMP
jgi:xylulose-5-phosphate/fructose-6-phosphate phosphoketolase